MRMPGIHRFRRTYILVWPVYVEAWVLVARGLGGRWHPDYRGYEFHADDERGLQEFDRLFGTSKGEDPSGYNFSTWDDDIFESDIYPDIGDR